ncbi:MAG: hypothetical protein WC859_00795 [Elusimicrobiota bacterium]|jgi:hypothetical protein
MQKYKSKKSGEIVISNEKTWRCKACAYNMTQTLIAEMGKLKGSYFLTLTTDIPFAPPATNIKDIQKHLGQFLRAFSYQYGSPRYFWGFGVTKRKKIHIHILGEGRRPSLKWIKRKWHKLTGYYIVHLKPAEETHVQYIAWNMARLPDYFSSSSGFSAIDRRVMRRFRRYGRSRGFCKKKMSTGDWEYAGAKERWTNLPTNHWNPPWSQAITLTMPLSSRARSLAHRCRCATEAQVYQTMKGCSS